MEIDLKEEIAHFKRVLEDVPFCCKKIIELNQEIDYKRHQMTGLARHGVDLTPEQERSSLSMPRYRSNKTLVDRMDEIDNLQDEIEYYRRYIYECALVDQLEFEERELLLDVYLFNKSRWDLAEKYFYSRRGLQKKIDSIVKKCLKGIGQKRESSFTNWKGYSPEILEVI